VSRHRGKLMFLGGLIAALAVGWLGFPIVLYETIDQPLQFSHATHTGDLLGMDCEACHEFDEAGRFCGVPGIALCATCHEEALGDSPAEQHLVEAFIHPNLEIPWLVYARQPDNVFFPHAAHIVLAEISCERCHGPHGHSDRLRPYQRNRISGYGRDIWGSNIAGIASAPWDGMKMGDCSRCHRQRGIVESCQDCHK